MAIASNKQISVRRTKSIKFTIIRFYTVKNHMLPTCLERNKMQMFPFVPQFRVPPGITLLYSMLVIECSTILHPCPPMVRGNAFECEYEIHSGANSIALIPCPFAFASFCSSKHSALPWQTSHALSLLHRQSQIGLLL
mmetsp:Transcript_36332/g.76561  ORF Transcript_36332/g.76561 Transcript_36332/m.76561 type:complete len:138 (+) Transcript_36332:1213-1626(+)